MAVEKARGCGFRKAGGLYLVGEGLGKTCGRLPIPITACPHCGEGIKVTRALKMISPSVLLDGMEACKAKDCRGCVLSGDKEKVAQKLANEFGKVGMIGVGKKYTPDTFIKEAREMGISKRIPQIPKQLVLGETWVFLSHRGACTILDEGGPEMFKSVPGVFYVFRPRAVEYISDGTDDPKALESLIKRGIKIVSVPADDPDHH